MLRFNKPKRGEGHEEQCEENSFAFSCLFSSKRRVQKWELLVGEELRRALEPGGSPRALDRYCITQSEEISPIFWCVVCGFFIILLLFPNFKYQTLKHPQLYSTNTPTEGSRENKFYITDSKKEQRFLKPPSPDLHLNALCMFPTFKGAASPLPSLEGHRMYFPSSHEQKTVHALLSLPPPSVVRKSEIEPWYQEVTLLGCVYEA